MPFAKANERAVGTGFSRGSPQDKDALTAERLARLVQDEEE